MTQIQVTNINRFDTYIEVGFINYIPMPSQFTGLTNALQIAQSYDSNYNIISGSTFTYTGTQSFPSDSTLENIQSKLITLWNSGSTQLNSFQLQTYDTLISQVYDGESWANIY